MGRLQRARRSKRSLFHPLQPPVRSERAYFEIKAGILGSNSLRRDVALAPDIVVDPPSLNERAVDPNEKSARCVREQTQFQLFLERQQFLVNNNFIPRVRRAYLLSRTCSKPPHPTPDLNIGLRRIL